MGASALSCFALCNATRAVCGVVRRPPCRTALAIPFSSLIIFPASAGWMTEKRLPPEKVLPRLQKMQPALGLGGRSPRTGGGHPGPPHPPTCQGGLDQPQGCPGPLQKSSFSFLVVCTEFFLAFLMNFCPNCPKWKFSPFWGSFFFGLPLRASRESVPWTATVLVGVRHTFLHRSLVLPVHSIGPPFSRPTHFVQILQATPKSVTYPNPVTKREFLIPNHLGGVGGGCRDWLQPNQNAILVLPRPATAQPRCKTSCKRRPASQHLFFISWAEW